DQLSPRGRGRRRTARHHARDPRRRSVLVDQRSPPVAAAARVTGADLSPSPADPRRRRQEAVEIDASDRPARAACAGSHARRDSHPGGAGRKGKAGLTIAILYVYNTYMTKKLTITVSDEVYEGLHRRIGRGKISRFIDDLARKHVIDRRGVDHWLTPSKHELRRAYAEGAAYEANRETHFKEEDEQ